MAYQGPVVQSIVSLTSSLMTNLLPVVAKVLSDALIFYCKHVRSFYNAKVYSHFFSKKYQCICHISRQKFKCHDVLANNCIAKPGHGHVAMYVNYNLQKNLLVQLTADKVLFSTEK